MKRPVLIAIVLMAVSISGFVLRKPKQQANQAPINSVRVTDKNSTSRITIGGKDLADVQASEGVERSVYEPKMNEQLVSEIRFHQLSGIKKSLNQNVLVFTDKSELYVTEGMKKQLPGHIGYRLELASENVRATRHGN